MVHGNAARPRWSALASKKRTYVTLDDDTVLESVRNDPSGFVRSLDTAIVDEVQRAPDLLRAIKKSVDADRDVSY